MRLDRRSVTSPRGDTDVTAAGGEGDGDRVHRSFDDHNPDLHTHVAVDGRGAWFRPLGTYRVCADLWIKGMTYGQLLVP